MVQRQTRPDLRALGLVFLAGLVLSAAVVLLYWSILNSTRNARLAADADLVQSVIEDRIGTYVAVLRSTASLFAVKPDLSRAEFARFVQGLELGSRLPGVQGVGFTKRLKPEEMAQIEAEARASGITDFQITPKYVREDYFSILYLEPLDARNRAALGYDMFSEPVRREAMGRARDQGEAAATGVVILKQEIDERKQPGFLIYYPIYRGGHLPGSVEERREALLGFAYSPFRAEDLLRGIFDEVPRHVEFELRDGAAPTAGELLYDSGAQGPRPNDLRARSTINVAGRPWALEVKPGASFDSSLGVGLRTVAIAGLLVTALITAVFGSESWRRRAAEHAGRILAAQREELKRVSEESAQSAAVLASLLQNAPIGFAFFDRDNRYVRVNGALAEMNGLSIEEHHGRKLRDVVHDVADRFEPILQRVFAENAVFPPMELVATPQHSPRERTWLCAFFPVTPHPGVVELVGVVVNDISERIQMEAELRERERRFRELADAMPQLVWIADTQGRVEYLNRQWRRLAGTELPSAGADWLKTVHPDEAPAASARWLEALQTGRPFEGEYRFYSAADGDFRWFLCRAVAVHGGLGQVLRWFGTCTDIQAQKAAEAERDLFLANERAARSEVERASRIKDEFLATLSHELRTPINAVLGWAQLLRMAGRSARDVEEGLETIERNSRVQAQLIEDLLDMSRIISGKVAFEVQAVEIDAIARDAVESVRHTAAARGVDLRIETDHGRPLVVLADPARMQQVFWNLLTNAIKFTPGGGAVSVSARQDGDYCKVSVSDTGQGIAPEFLPFVFDRFRQADASTTRKHGGLGLGLAIVRNLVELHGGTVAAESAGEGRGATFVVTLPMHETHHPRIEASPAPAGQSLNEISVLVVDDERDALKLVKRVLEEARAKVFCAESGAEALELYRRHKPDIIVSDIGMPEMDGYMLIKEIRRLESGANGVRALALTAFAREDDRKHALKAGYQSYLPKPFDPAHLVSAVAELAQRLPSVSTNDAVQL